MKKFLFLVFLTFLSLATRAERRPDGGNIWDFGSGILGLAYQIVLNPVVLVLLAISVLIFVIKRYNNENKYGYKSTNDLYGYHKQFHPGAGGGDKPKEEKKS